MRKRDLLIVNIRTITYNELGLCIITIDCCKDMQDVKIDCCKDIPNERNQIGRIVAMDL